MVSELKLSHTITLDMLYVPDIEILRCLSFLVFLENLALTFPSDEYAEQVHSEDFKELEKSIITFAETEAEKKPTFSLWLSYIQMVQILLMFLRGTRENDWNLHLSAVRSMLPWYFAADRVHYARYGTIYWLEMLCLEATHAGQLFLFVLFLLFFVLYKMLHNVNLYLAIGIVCLYHFLIGATCDILDNWTCQRQTLYGFSSTACDQVMEQTYNRDSKVRGGLVGFTLNRSAVHRWIMSQSARGAITRQCRSMTDHSSHTR